MERSFGDQNRIVKLLDRDASKRHNSTQFTALSDKTTDSVQHPPILPQLGGDKDGKRSTDYKKLMTAKAGMTSTL